MTKVFEHMEFEGIDKLELWDEIKDIVRKTVMSIQETLKRNYTSLQPRSKKMDM